MPADLIRPGTGRESIRLDTEQLKLRHLDFTVLALRAGEQQTLEFPDRELALLTVAGTGTAQVGQNSHTLSRKNVFEEMSSVLYAPPDTAVSLTAKTDWRVAVGSAPASGRYPVRLIEPAEMRVELRGGGVALRQVNHPLSHPLPAERLIIYEVYVPAGAWAGWPPHCHDGWHGSPCLEETYFFRFDRDNGFGFHRNYVEDGTFDEVFTVHDGDCVVVPRGFHVTTPSPASNMWVLNFLAGEPVHEERATPPYFDPTTTWITDDWSQGRIGLPAVTPDTAPSRAIR
jgi:5-deoxy-glucuronate isomerase